MVSDDSLGWEFWVKEKSIILQFYSSVLNVNK